MDNSSVICSHHRESKKRKLSKAFSKRKEATTEDSINGEHKAKKIERKNKQSKASAKKKKNEKENDTSKEVEFPDSSVIGSHPRANKKRKLSKAFSKRKEATTKDSINGKYKAKSLERKSKQSKASAKRKQPEKENDTSKEVEFPLTRNSDDPVPKKVKWTNKQRVLIFACRGITVRDRLLLEDLRTLLPHSKRENKKDGDTDLEIINEISVMNNCNKCIYFVAKKKKNLYMWLSNISSGPSIKFLVQNHHSMRELKMTGNSLRGSRPLVCFDSNFNAPHWALIKELIGQTFNVSQGHPKSQPFIDRVFVFSLVDNKIWFRNFQIVEEDGQLTEIGPRFVLNPIKIFEGSFGGVTLWSNPHYVSPNNNRMTRRQWKMLKGLNKFAQKKEQILRTKLLPTQFIGDPTSDFFQTKPPEEAKGREKMLFVRKNPKEKNERKGL